MDIASILYPLHLGALFKLAVTVDLLNVLHTDTETLHNVCLFTARKFFILFLAAVLEKPYFHKIMGRLV